MWLRVGIIAFVVAALLVIPSTGLALAQTPPTGGASGSITLDGRAALVQGENQTLLQIIGDGIGGSGWRLEALLSPIGVQRSGGDEDGGTVAVLQGNFTLANGAGSVQGQIQATLTRRGTGDMSLTSLSDNTDLTSSFRLDQRGATSLVLLGQLPAFDSSNLSAPGPQAPTALARADTGGGHFFWYLSRSAAFTAYALLFLNVCLGLLVHTGWVDRIFARWRSFDLHQFTGLLAMAFLALHVFSLLGDRYFNFGIVQLLVPLTSPYRPLWTGFGVVAMYLLAAIVGSFYIRAHIGRRAWRALHYFSFGAFVLVLAHGLLAGTDATADWARLLYIGTGTTVAMLTLWRIGWTGQAKGPGRLAAAGAGRNGV